MDIEELIERIDDIKNLMTPENMAELSEDELDSLNQLLEGLEALLEQ